MKYLIVFVSIGCISAIFTIDSNYERKYEPNWDSLDTRPLPEWYDRAKIGIFLHWGVYAVPGFGSEWFWMNWRGSNLPAYVDFMKRNFASDFSYQDFAKDFTAEFFEPEDWAKIFKASGAKYVVLTSKHHEGYTMWPSTYSFSWNAMDVGPHRDLLGDLAKAVRNQSLHMGFYHSMYEWFNPRYLVDKSSNFSTRAFVTEKVFPELMELVNTYKPEVIWSDGDWEAEDVYWNSTGFLAWLYNQSPVKDTIVVNDRWGRGIPCKHGDFFTCSDRYDPGVLQPHKWENAMTMDKYSWGFRRNMNYKEVLTTFELIQTLARTVSCGGNILINVGPTKEGTIAAIFQERLLDLGKWLAVNGEAIYESTPWTVQNDTLANVWYTSKPSAVYAISLAWPEYSRILLGSAAELFTNASTVVHLLGYNMQLKWIAAENFTVIYLPEKAKIQSEWAWVLKISNFN